MIASGFIADLLARVDIVDVIGRHVQLKKGGANLMGLCPFHGEKSPSFSVSPSKQFYYCFGCGASGDAIRFLTEHTGASFRDAVTDLAQQVGLPVPDDTRSDDERREAAAAKARQTTLTDVLERAAAHYRQQLKGNARPVGYLKGRGLTGEVAARFGLGYAPDGWHALASAFAQYDDPLLAEAGLVIVNDEGDEQRRYDRFRDRVMFPIRAVGGETIGFGGRVLDRGEPKYLNSPETPVFVKGRELYGLYESRAGIRARGHALVVEGYMDVVALAQMGFDNAVATLGTACTEEHVRKLFRFTDAVVFSFDGDAAGRRAATRALEAALPHATDLRSIRFLFLPPEHDPDSFVRELGAPAFERAIAQAVPLSRQIVDVAREGCDLGTPEGRARFASQARPLWSALPEGGLKRQMLSELNKAAALPEGELAASWSAAGANRSENARTAPGMTRAGRAPSAFAASRRAPRKPEDRIVALLLMQPAWWDALTAEDHELLHALPSPHAQLVGWLERDIVEHGPRPWAAVRTALAADDACAAALAALRLDDSDDFEADASALRLLIDDRLVQALKARQRELEGALARSDPVAVAAHRQAQDRIRALGERMQAARLAASSA